MLNTEGSLHDTEKTPSDGAQETLEFALREYEGAVVVVSHDRWDTRGHEGNGGCCCR